MRCTPSTTRLLWGEEFVDCDLLIEPAIAAMVTGEAGAFDSAWLQSTPDVSIAGNSEELDRLSALTEGLLKAADGCEPGTDCKVKTVGALETAPLSNVKKRRLLQQRLAKSKPRNYVRQSTAGVAGYALLAALVWAATIAVAVAGGVVPHAVHTFDHAAPLHAPAEGIPDTPRFDEVREPIPPDLNDPMVRQEQWLCYSAPS